MNSNADHIVVKPMTVNTGAEIHGVDLSQPICAAEVAVIRSALLKWKVVFFRKQNLDHAQHIAFAKLFGELTPGHVVFGGDQEYPEIYPVIKDRKSLAGRRKALRTWTDWHTDITAAINPPSASILRAVVVPEYGGDTQWSNMVAAYKSLSPPMQKFIETLRAVHQYNIADNTEGADEYNSMLANNRLVAEHPMVIVHHDTGEKALYTNPEFVDHVVDLTAGESDALLHYLWEHSVRAEFSVRFRWEKGSIAFWDNRATQHIAIHDVYETDFDRTLYRITLNGTIPVGVDGQQSTLISGNPIQATL